MTPAFKKNNYMVIRKAIDPKIAEFVMNYFMMKRQVARTMFDERYISPFTTEWGVWNDVQAPETYSHYGDVAMETLLLAVLPKMEKETGLKLYPTYAYARIYKNGDILHRHKDRFSCEISTTMNLGGDKWPIYIEPNPKKGGDTADGYKSEYTDGVEVDLKPGDMLVYKGNICEHWRDHFDGKDCAQVFLHYNNQATKGSKDNLFDGRKHLGLPSWWKDKTNHKDTKY
tara:strand:- start:130 stop:813 length:684 start_codon:yes stop_codon:yes gene_type:complete